MQAEDRIKALFGAAIETKIAVADHSAEIIVKAGLRLVDCLLKDKKILLCGNGGSAANCLHFSVAMMSHFEAERPALPVLPLSYDALATASLGLANDKHADQIFSRQIQALGQEGDLLLVLTTSGNSNNLLAAIEAANSRGIDIIVLNGRDGGILASHLGPEDIEIRIQADNAARIREIHLFILHCFCDLIEHALFGQLME